MKVFIDFPSEFFLQFSLELEADRLSEKSLVNNFWRSLSYLNLKCFLGFSALIDMPRKSLVRLVFALACLLNVGASFLHPAYVRFAGQEFCARRLREHDGVCCPNRIDECAVPIGDSSTGWSKCYCDEFCDRRDNPDCCPDYESVCKGRPAVKTCKVNGKSLQVKQETKVDCNLW